MAEQILPVTGDTTIPEPLQRQLERAREQGRREILAEVAKINPFSRENGYDYQCFFCLGTDKGQPPPEPDRVHVVHKPACIWSRAVTEAFDHARAAVESAQANHEQP